MEKISKPPPPIKREIYKTNLIRIITEIILQPQLLTCY